MLHGSSDVKFRLGTASTAAFTALLAEMDTRLGELGVLHYGLSMTTLEEVSAAGVVSAATVVSHAAWARPAAWSPAGLGHGMRICRRLELHVRIYTICHYLLHLLAPVPLPVPASAGAARA